MRSIAVAGIITQKRSLTTRKGSPMAVVMLEDREGGLESVIFPEVYAKYQSLLEVDRVVVARGKLEKDEESARLIVSELQPIEAVSNGGDRTMAIRLTTPPHNRGTVEALANLLRRHQGPGRVVIEIDVRREDRPIRVKTDLSHMRIRPSENLVKEVEELCGEGAVSWLED